MTVLLDISLLFPFDTICISLSDGKTMLLLSPVLKFTFVNVNVFVVEFQLHPSSLFSSSWINLLTSNVVVLSIVLVANTFVGQKHIATIINNIDKNIFLIFILFFSFSFPNSLQDSTRSVCKTQKQPHDRDLIKKDRSQSRVKVIHDKMCL